MKKFLMLAAMAGGLALFAAGCCAGDGDSWCGAKKDCPKSAMSCRCGDKCNCGMGDKCKCGADCAKSCAEANAKGCAMPADGACAAPAAGKACAAPAAPAN